MTMNDILNLYEKKGDDLLFHAISPIRIKLMILLNEGTKRTKELRKEADDLSSFAFPELRSSTVLHSLKKLKRRGLVTSDDGYFS